MQAHDDDDDAGQDRKFCRPGADQAADQGGTGAERHEDGGKTQHEHQRRRHHRPLGGLRGVVVGDMLDGRAGEIDQIGRHQGQHAGGQEADETGNQGRRDGNIVHCMTFENCHKA